MQEHTETGLAPREGVEDDADLMRKIATGDQKSFQRLLRRHLAKTVRLASRMLGGHSAAAEDVAQEAFIKIWQHAGDFEDPEKAGARFTTWLYKIVLHLCIDEKRKRSFSGIDDIEEPHDGKDSAETGLQRQEQSAKVRGALDALPPRQRAALVLCFYEDYSNKEAAEMMGIGLKALEALLVRARRDLRKTLAGEEVR